MHYYLFLIGLPLTGYGLLLCFRQLVFLFRSRKVRGRLSDWKQNGYYWYPEVSYMAHDGTVHTVVGPTGVRPKPEPALGRTLSVRYLEQASDQAKVCTFLQFWGAPLVFLVLGGSALWALISHL